MPTSPASATEPLAATVADLQRRELRRLFGGFVAGRIAFMPMPMIIATWLAIADPTPWRRLLLLGCVLLMTSLSLRELWLFRTRGVEHLSANLNFGVAVAVQLSIIFATGGLESPIVPTLPVLTLAFALFLPGSLARASYLAQIGAVWIMLALALGRGLPTLVPLPFGGGPRAGHNDAHLILSAILVTVMLTVVFLGGGQLRKAYARMVGGLQEARDAALLAHAEKAQLLETLAGELAHELKNPLASVKGLAALVAKDAVELPGKSAERLAVLRGEVDRMQEILEELLNFSRPVAPLAMRSTDLTELCRQVVEQHEGMAAAQKVSLLVEAPGSPELKARCDARKIKQILVNLVQNALEASSSEGHVKLRVERVTKGRVAISVRDRGAGLRSDLAERIFEAGVTSKPTGSGLGLTIARTLAEQHGGAIQLTAQEGGGVCATLELPEEGASG